MSHSEAKGSLKTEKAFWDYADLELEASIPYSTLKKYVHWGVFRRGKEYLKLGRTVKFIPKKAMERLRYIGANRDVLRQAKAAVARRV